MIPVMIDPSTVRLVVIGGGPAAVRRVSQLVGAGARNLTVFSPSPDQAMVEAAGSYLREALPSQDDFGGVGLAYVAGMDQETAGSVAQMARAAGVLVNVEDVGELCDFHVPGTVRRGDLLLTVSTGGKSPGLARRLVKVLAEYFGPEWGGRLDELSSARSEWIVAGCDRGTVVSRTDRMIEDQGWLQ